MNERKKTPVSDTFATIFWSWPIWMAILGLPWGFDLGLKAFFIVPASLFLWIITAWLEI